jgi:phenylacetate-CoA ligase
VLHSYERVPFYRELYRSAGLEPQDIRSLDDLHRIPVIARSDIQNLGTHEICADGVRAESLLVRRTSGSSGAPLTIRRSWLEERLLLALKLQASFGLGLNLRSSRVFITNSSSAAPWKKSLYQAPLQSRLKVLPVFELDWQQPKADLVDHLTRLQPDIVIGAPSILSWVAEELDEKDRECFRPRLTVAGGEQCTPEAKERIERGFGAPVAESYGSHEFVFLALEAPGANEFAVCGASAIVEVLRDGHPVEPGQSGEVVITGLHSFAMPFIRYRLGDLVETGDTPGWHPHSVQSLRSILGRTIDRFILADGAVIHPYTVANLLRDDEPWLRRFQIVQFERNRFSVRVVPFVEPSPQTTASTARKLEAAFPEPVEVTVEIVEDLLPTETGKFYPYVAFERYKQWGYRAVPSGD